MHAISLYEILNISPNAEPEIIKAAYRTMCQKYHPDKCQSQIEKDKATEMMTLINEAYQTLSDPTSRHWYDVWLNHQRQAKTAHRQNYEDNKNFVVTVNYGGLHNTLKDTKEKCIKNTISFLGVLVIFYHKIMKLIYFLLIAICLCLFASVFVKLIIDKDYYNQNKTTNSQPQATPQNPKIPTESTKNTQNKNATPNNSIQTDDRKLFAPNGQRFPKTAGYVKGYPKLNKDGLSTLTIENTQNNNAVFGKLYYLSTYPPKAVRYFYIPAYGGLILRDITAGSYDVRYMDLDSGTISKSESFNLQEINNYTGTRFSQVTMTLYKVANGNMETTTIPDSEF